MCERQLIKQSRLLLNTVLLCSALFASAQAQPSAAPDSSVTTLERAGVVWDSLFNSGNIEALTNTYAEDVTSMPFSAPTVHGRKALKAELEKFLAAYNARHETRIQEILTGENWAIELATYTMVFSPREGGAETIETGRHVMKRVKKDGKWFISWEIWNTDIPPDADGE